MHWHLFEILFWDLVNGKTVTQKNVVAVFLVFVNFSDRDTNDHNVFKRFRNLFYTY